MATRIQVCGAVTAEVDGRRIERELPGRQGRLLFVYLVLARPRPTGRAELLDALWPDAAPASAESSLSALLSRLRRAVGEERLTGRSELRLELPDDAWVDVDAATEALHRAESAAARGDWTGAWGPARVAQHVAVRGFLPGEDAPWIEQQRRRLEELHVRALELAGRASVEIGGAELDTAERAARALIEAAPYRESGYRLLMEALAARGNGAEALVVYERLRARLRDDLGAAPSQATKDLHRRLLADVS
ncbi:MAG TPA: BTAD domain-containing putative transcriptional regulator [Gaiellaceae bacterium]|nr:BTAD domain-containing putative transcriptional regulator [Gaiellaceae bacterium]